MRLFTAIELPPDMLLRLERLLSALRPEALIKWSPLDNLHVTTKFIGHWPDERLTELQAALEPLTERPPFELEVRNLGWFPNTRAPRVLFAGVEGGEPLRDLAHETESLLSALGVRKDGKPFSPHLTLARIPQPVPLAGLRQRLAGMHAAPLGRFPVQGFCLFRSEPGSNASLYRRLGEYRFLAARAAC
jgi:2'-5' RNA ligase